MNNIVERIKILNKIDVLLIQFQKDVVLSDVEHIRICTCYIECGVHNDAPVYKCAKHKRRL